MDSLALTQASSVGNNEDSGLVFYFEIYSHYVSVGGGAQTHGDPPASAAQVLGFQECTANWQQHFKVF